jgi:hypothetical protein
MDHCPDCKTDFLTVRVAMKFRPISGGYDWYEAPVLANVCGQCGRLDFHLAQPQQFAEWLQAAPLV